MPLALPWPSTSSSIAAPPCAARPWSPLSRPRRRSWPRPGPRLHRPARLRWHARAAAPRARHGARAKAELSERLSALETGSGTALHEAVDLGAASLRRVLVPGARPKLLLLTDGEPSVGPSAVTDFRQLGSKVAESGLTLHALGLGRHYMPEILEALTSPSGTGFSHADDAEALPTTVAGIVTELFGEVASEARVHVLPSGFAELRCRHRYPARVEGDAMSVLLGSVSQACLRRALFTGRLSSADWNLTVTASFIGARRHAAPLRDRHPRAPRQPPGPAGARGERGAGSRGRRGRRVEGPLPARCRGRRALAQRGRGRAA